MYSFRKSKKGFTLIELMVVVVIIGVLALLGLRLYLTQIEKSNNALIKANAGTVQTTIQADLADLDGTAVMLLWTTGATVTASGIHNPMTKLVQAGSPITFGAAVAGEVWVEHNPTLATFSINGKDAAGLLRVYTTTDLTAKY